MFVLLLRPHVIELSFIIVDEVFCVFLFEHVAESVLRPVVLLPWNAGGSLLYDQWLRVAFVLGFLFGLVLDQGVNFLQIKNLHFIRLLFILGGFTGNIWQVIENFGVDIWGYFDLGSILLQRLIKDDMFVIMKPTVVLAFGRIFALLFLRLVLLGLLGGLVGLPGRFKAITVLCNIPQIITHASLFISYYAQ